jgi:hypothetical protein
MRTRTAFFIPLLLFLLGCVLLPACAGLMPVTPKTPAETLLTVEQEYTAVIQTATEMRRSGAVADDAYQHLLGTFREINDGLALAHTAYSVGDVSTMQGQLALARAGILRVRALLVAQQKKGGA